MKYPGKKMMLQAKSTAVPPALRDDASIQREAIRAGIGSGVIGGMLGALEGVFMMPEFVRKMRDNGKGKTLLRSVRDTVTQNKLLTILVAAPVIVGGISGIWGYVSAKATLKARRRETDADEKVDGPERAVSVIEEERKHVLPSASTVGWVEKIATKDALTPRHR